MSNTKEFELHEAYDKHTRGNLGHVHLFSADGQAIAPVLLSWCPGCGRFRVWLHNPKPFNLPEVNGWRDLGILLAAIRPAQCSQVYFELETHGKEIIDALDNYRKIWDSGGYRSKR